MESFKKQGGMKYLKKNDESSVFAYEEELQHAQMDEEGLADFGLLM